MNDQEPSLEYAGTSGHARVESSREAIIHDDMTGVTAAAQRLALVLAGQAGAHGITIAELREAKGALHHGKMSSALTNLHKAGLLAALRERRDRCGVYVLPKHVNGRETRAYKPNQKPLDPEVIVGILIRHRYIDSQPHRPSGCVGCEWSGAIPGGLSFNQHVAAAIVEELS